MQSGAPPKRLVVFAHYDAQGEVKRYIVHYLRALRRECARLVFVSTATLGAEEIAKIDGLCDEIVHRDNVGFDFAMWRDVIDRVDLAAWDELVLANSSVFGPLFPLRHVFERMAARECDAWGMTENDELSWHLQSFFLVFRKPVLEAPIFRQFWSSVLPFRDKRQVIRSYEIGLSRLLLDHGFKLDTFAPTEALGRWHERLRPRPVNPTCGRPMPLLRAGMPFVKAELLRDNPMGVELEPVIREMARVGFDFSLLQFDRPVKANGLSAETLERLKRSA
jgi:lipopolysaccharide biosynthesis protein